MEQFKGNSNVSKNANNPSETTLPTKPKIEPIVANVKVRKESEISKFGKRFISEDAKSVGSHLFDEVVIPGLQRLLSDAVKNGIDWIIWGIKGGSKPSSGVGNVSYSKYYDRTRPPVAPASYSKPAAYTINEVTFDNRGEAEEVLMRLCEEIDRYQMVSIADFYDMISQKHSYTDLKYGWKDLSTAEVVRARDGYSIRFPKVIPLE